MRRTRITWLAALLALAGGMHDSPVVAQQSTFPIDLVAGPRGWPAADYPLDLPPRGAFTAAVTLDFNLACDPPPASRTEFSYILHPVAPPSPCPARQCLHGQSCYPCPANDRNLGLGPHRFQNELSSQMIEQNGRSWNIYLWTTRFGAEPGARLTGSLTVTVRTQLVQPDPEITVNRPPDQWLVPADRRLDVAWTRVGLMALTVHIDLLDGRGRQAARLAKGTANDGQEAAVIPPFVAAGSYRVRVETVDGKVKGDSGVIHVPPV